MVLEMNWRDNHWFDDVLKAEMEYDRRRDPDKFAHIWEGAFLQNSSLRVFLNWKVEEFEADQIEGLSGPYGGADWGFSVDPTFALRCFVQPDTRKIYVDYEARKLRLKVSDTAEFFERSIPGFKETQIRADSARPETIAEVRAAGFRIVGATKGKDSVKEGVEFLKSYDIVVHPRCRYLIDELTHFKWKPDRLTGEPTNELEDANNHGIDALRYALELVRNKGKHDFW
jgi:phage terminase large subunit